MGREEWNESVSEGNVTIFCTDGRLLSTGIIQGNMLLSNMFTNILRRIILVRICSDDSMGQGDPVKMDGEISVILAKPGSREVKANEIGIELKIKSSDQDVYESVYMHKVGNGTVVLEVSPAKASINGRQMEMHINKLILVLKHMSSLRFLPRLASPRLPSDH